jgi:hypothetical protein
MKKHFFFLFFLLFFFSLQGIRAQQGFFNPYVPLKHQSPAFGKDIIINYYPGQDQRNVTLCSAFNGWLYAAYSYYYPVGQFMAVNIYQSTDNGITWNSMNWEVLPPTFGPPITVSIAAGGNTLSTLKLFVAWTITDTTIYTYPGFGEIDRFNGVTGEWETMLTHFDNCWDISLATDGLYPATNSNPFSVGVLYSVFHVPGLYKDSVIFYSSGDGGMTFGNRQVLATTSKRFPKVSLAYGRSHSDSTGRYFATWEEDQTYKSGIGDIYTSHSNPDFNSAFTNPVWVNSLDSSAINKSRRPVIACQSSGLDNDSSNLTELIMFEKQLSPNTYDTRGFYNLKSTTSNQFDEFSITSLPNNKIQPDIAFNPFDSTFMLTYYDSVAHGLPFLINDVNLANPGAWNVQTQEYNDSPDIAAPFPIVALNPGEQAGATVWAKEGSGGNGVAMFDAPYSTYTEIKNTKNENNTIIIYPNPARDKCKVQCAKCNIKNIEIFNLCGEKVYGAEFPAGGGDAVEVNLDFPEGVYFVQVTSDKIVEVGKIIKE